MPLNVRDIGHHIEMLAQERYHFGSEKRAPLWERGEPKGLPGLIRGRPREFASIDPKFRQLNGGSCCNQQKSPGRVPDLAARRLGLDRVGDDGELGLRSFDTALVHLPAAPAR